jgi:predicted NBD/HSP70 family sugar kinase
MMNRLTAGLPRDLFALGKARYLRPSPSEASILAEVVRLGLAPQPTIAAGTSLSQQSVSRIVGELVDRGALRFGEKAASGRRGQPSSQVEVVPEYAYSLGVGLMTDAMSVVLMDFAGRVIDYRMTEMAAMTRSAVLERLEIALGDFVTARRIDRDRIFGVGVGISGYCLDGNSRYNTVHALDDWAMVELDRTFSDLLGIPAWVENDGNAAAIGESLLGVGRTHPSFVYIFIAAGVGGGVVINHELMRGRHGNAGEVALILPKNIYMHPSLETLRQTLARRGVAVDGISDLVRRFDPNWPGVDEWVERTRDSFSLMASSIAALVDPDAIVLGGRIPRALAEKVIPHIEIYDNTRRAEPRPFPRILMSETTQDACAIGAASMPLKRYFFSG